MVDQATSGATSGATSEGTGGQPDAAGDVHDGPSPALPDRYCVNVPLRWSDMDAYGHVNNVQFLRLLEDARVIGFEEWFGQDRSVLAEGILVARHEIEYLAPLLFRVPPIVVQMWATKIGGAGFDLAYEVRDGLAPEDTVYARAETTLVLYDFATSTPRRMAPDLKALLEEHAGDPVPFRWRRR